MVDAQTGGVQWRWKFSPGLPGKKRIFGNDGRCLKPEDFPKCTCQSQDLLLVPASSEDFPRGCVPITGLDLLQILPQPEDFPRGHIPITGFTAVLLSACANHRTYHNSPAST